MPKVSKTTAAERTIVPGMIDSAMAELDGYLVEIQSWDVDMDMAFAAKGLPNDQCQAAHVGYVVRGKVTLHMADGTDEVYEGGDVYVLEAGHTSTVTAGTEFITITRIEDAMAQADVVRANMMTYAAEHGIEAQR